MKRSYWLGLALGGILMVGCGVTPTASASASPSPSPSIVTTPSSAAVASPPHRWVEVGGNFSPVAGGSIQGIATLANGAIYAASQQALWTVVPLHQVCG